MRMGREAKAFLLIHYLGRSPHNLPTAMPENRSEMASDELFAIECDWMVGHGLALSLRRDRPQQCRSLLNRSISETCRRVAGGFWFHGCGNACCPHCGNTTGEA